MRRHRDKARVENYVAFVRKSWLQGERFVDFADAREHAEHWCREVAGGRMHGTTRRVPRIHYEEVERVYMLPAPSESFDVPHWTEAKVHGDHLSRSLARCTRSRRATSAARCPALDSLESPRCARGASSSRKTAIRAQRGALG